MTHYNSSEESRSRADRIETIAANHEYLREILSQPPSYESLTENTDLLRQIDQWETETVRQVKEVAGLMRGKVRQQSDTLATERFRPEFGRLTEAMTNAHQMNDADLRQLMKQFSDLKVQMEDSLLTTAELRTMPIPWSQHIRLVSKSAPTHLHERTINLNNLISTRPRFSLDVKGAEWHILSTCSPVLLTFLHYQDSPRSKRLSRISMEGNPTPITWFQDQSIWDSCWSSYLNKFILLADARLYTYDETIPGEPIQWIQNVLVKRSKMEFLRCACSDETLLVTYDERNSSIDEYKMDQWTLVRHHENIVHNNEIIISIAFSATNPNLIGMTVLDDRQHWHFELRNRALSLISSVPLDKSEFNRRLISLPNSTMNWLIMHMGTKFLTVIDQNGRQKTITECAEHIDLATYSREKNCLVLLTQKSKLKFFDV